jgi:hypothetical protein
MVGKVRAPYQVALATGLLWVSGCAEESPPLPARPDLSTGGEVFHILCKRVAAAAYPNELTGLRFNAPCDGGGEAAVGLDPRFAAMVERRAEIVAALDQLFGDKPTDDTAAFEDGELDRFLADLIPFYDKPDEWTPRSTRALEKILGELLADKPASKKVLTTLERVAPRVGYRPLRHVLGTVRPALSYPAIDELTRQFLALVSKDGAAYPVWLDLLEAGALELAEPKAADAPPADQSTLRAALDLLFIEDEALAPEGASPLWVVKRDDRGFALPSVLETPFVDDDGDGLADIGKDGNLASSTGKSIQSPFPRELSDRKNRDAEGRALNGEEPLYQHVDANRTVLSALLREQYPLMKRDGDKSAIEKLARGLRPIMGASVERTETFGDKASLKYQGPEVEAGPVFDLVHALSSLARYEETDRLLQLLEILMREHESDAAAPLFAGLRIDEISDEFPNAFFVGADGQGTPHEFWDDLIQVGDRMLERKGMLEEVLRSFADPQSVAATKLIAKFMKFKDQVSYNGAPLKIAADGKYSEADAVKMNSEIKATFKQLVERPEPGTSDLSENPDVGMNRSLFQRLLSSIHATNGVPNCNMEGGQLLVNDPLTGTPLVFPDPYSQAPGAITLIADLACGEMPQFTGKKGYPECTFVKQPNGAETFMRSMVPPLPPGKAVIVVKDDQLHCLEAAHLANDLGETQEENAQITGFTLAPTPQSLARFIHAPRNKFLTTLFAPFATKHGVPLAEFEPDILLALEITQTDILFGGKPQSFLTSAQPLGAAFDKFETFTDSPDSKVASKGYMFAELLATLHKHWPSRRPEGFLCSATVKKGDEGCSQSSDPSKPFYAPQSNLVSYEPLLIRAIEEENLAAILQKSNTTLSTIKIDGRDGVKILAEFLERVLTVDETLRYRNGKNYSATNTCTPVESSGPNGEAVAECMEDSEGRVKGRVIQGVKPLYLVLDALKGIDKAFEGENVERHEPWLQARSILVDQFLSVTKTEGADPANPAYALQNRRAHAVTLKLLPWVRNRIKLHRDAGDLEAWADGLSGRLAGVLGHPATAAGLDLLDVLWKEDKAGAEFAKFNAYLMDEESNPGAFEGLLVAATDTLMLLDRDPDLTPLVQFAALGLAPNALDIIKAGGAPNVEESAALTTIELTKRISDLYPGPDASPISRLLKNGVLPNGTGEAPIETFIDTSAEVNRKDPTDPSDKPLVEGDYRAVFEQVRVFLNDPERGLERLYR